MKKLTIRWQRLVSETGQTCPRCRDTGIAIDSVVNKLKKSLLELDIDVEFTKESIDFLQFSSNTLQSNRILIGNKSLEEWLGGTVGKSKCCDVCGDSECRSILLGQSTYETIPENLIIMACLKAAAELFSATPWS